MRSHYSFGFINLSTPTMPPRQLTMPGEPTPIVGTVTAVAQIPKIDLQTALLLKPAVTGISPLLSSVDSARRAPPSSASTGQTTDVRPSIRDLQMSPDAITALTAPRVGTGVLQSVPGSGSGSTSAASSFAAACATAGGAVVGQGVCQLADGAKVSIDANGNAVCVNTVGRCAGAGSGISPALLLGGAALLALTLLR